MKVEVGLLGYGTVGSGVYSVIKEHQEQLQAQLGCQVVISKILVRDIEKKRMGIEESHILTNQPDDILEDPSIQVIIEVMGGTNKSYEYIKQALTHGKSVVTANKDVIALYGPVLYQLATENEADLYFEAAVAGGIPVIRSLVDGLASDRVNKIMGIVNGTTNYILTKMSQNGWDYQMALDKAQELGFAEPDPTSDVDGLDAARKMVILSSLAFSMDVKLDDVHLKGIRDIPKQDIEDTKKLGYIMKLIGVTSIEDGAVEVSVEPTLLPEKHPLASVDNEFNAVYIYGSSVGETMFFGPGAGSLPTATAIVSDVISAIRNSRLGVKGKSIQRQFEKSKIKEAKDIKARYFLRLKVKDEVGVLHKITEIFTKHKLSFESVLQGHSQRHQEAKLVIVTHEVVLEEFLAALGEIEKLETVLGIECYYRVES